MNVVVRVCTCDVLSNMLLFKRMCALLAVCARTRTLLFVQMRLLCVYDFVCSLVCCCACSVYYCLCFGLVCVRARVYV